MKPRRLIFELFPPETGAGKLVRVLWPFGRKQNRTNGSQLSMLGFHCASRWPGIVRTQMGVIILLLAMSPRCLLGADGNDPVAPRTELKFNFAKSMFTGVNENDAQAAMKVYAQTIGDQNGLYVNSAPNLLDGTNGIAKAIAAHGAELFALTTTEFLSLEQLGLEGPLLMSSMRQRFTEEYVLLSRADGSLRRPEDLKGRSLIVCNDVRSCLAPLWLEVLCREHGLGPAAGALDKITFSFKPMQVVMPVFFGKAEACLVTRNSWETMCELNPQLEKQLRIIARSPPLVPALTCFGPNVSEAMKQQVLRALELSATKPSYRQLMELFKCDRVGYQPPTVLDNTRELVAKYEALCTAAKATTPPPPPPVATAKEAPLK